MTSPDLSVTIINHSSCDLLRTCLRSLHDHPYTLGEVEIIVLDNASDDQSVEMVRREFPSVRLFAERERRGFGANQNRAIAGATNDLVFMLNPDASIHEGTLDELVLAVVSNPGIAAAGGCVYNTDGSIRQASLHRFETPLTPFASALGLDRFRNRQPSEELVSSNGWPSGGACLVRRDVFMELEGFDEGFFMYSEDTDLFTRMVRGGHLIAWVPEIRITHPFPEESGAATARREAEKVRSSMRYMRKHYGTWGGAIHRSAMAFDAFVRIIVLSIPGPSRLVRHHGQPVKSLRRRYLARLRCVLRPGPSIGLAESAAAWNAAKDAD